MVGNCSCDIYNNNNDNDNNNNTHNIYIYIFHTMITKPNVWGLPGRISEWIGTHGHIVRKYGTSNFDV